MPEFNKQFFKDMGVRLFDIVRWLGMGVLVGILVGGVSVLFGKGLEWVTGFRKTYTWMVYLLPVSGLLIVGLYKLLRNEDDKGTNLVFSSISADDDVPIKMAPSIFFGTLLTHLCGGSAGREGAALQLGGSIGNAIGKLFHFDKIDRKVMIMCGMSAAFSAIFGTPMAAAVFAIEVATVGVMYYSAIFPCIVSALVARLIAQVFGFAGESFLLSNVPEVGPINLLRTLALGILCGVVALLFCAVLFYMKKWEKQLIKNPFLRIVVAAAIFIGITALIGNGDFYGAGTELIERATMEGEVEPYAFALKMVLTALILGGGFKGGEIVPSFCIGATFGCVVGKLLGLPATLGAALGMTAVFCGVTNCPIAAMLISFELFGFDAVPYIMLVTGVSYVVSGYISLYSDQVFLHSKYRPNIITHKIIKPQEGRS